MNGLEPRLLCVRTLMRSLEAGSYGNLALHHALARAEDIDPRDRALCTRLFQNTMERLLTLDACIAAHVSRPPEKLDPAVRAVLRCGICELLYFSTPESAAVNLWTEAVKRLKKTSAAGMVNAVLRGFLRADKEIPLPGDAMGALSVAYSVPVPLLQMLTEEHGEDAVRAFLEDAAQPPPIYLRRNPLKCTAAEFAEAVPDAVPVPAVPFAYVLARGGEALDEAKVTGAHAHVQDLASQLCCLALDPQPGETVLDVCAAPGGKTFTIAELMQNQGRVLACDLHENRVNLIRSGAQRLGLSCITAQTGDARQTEKPQADRVLCDVPCSGYGVLRRKPEIRYKSPESVAGLPQIQLDILRAAAKAVKPGGVLVYSTCTVLKRENADVVTQFLKESPDFSLEAPFAKYPEIAEKTGGADMLTLLPQMLGSDGFFLAKLRRAD